MADDKKQEGKNSEQGHVEVAKPVLIDFRGKGMPAAEGLVRFFPPREGSSVIGSVELRDEVTVRGKKRFATIQRFSLVAQDPIAALVPRIPQGEEWVPDPNVDPEMADPEFRRKLGAAISAALGLKVVREGGDAVETSGEGDTETKEG